MRDFAHRAISNADVRALWRSAPVQGVEVPPSASVTARRRGLVYGHWLVLLSFSFGLFHPISQDGFLVVWLYYGSAVVLGTLYGLLLIRGQFRSQQGIRFGGIVLGVLALFTLLTPMPRVAFSIGVHYVLLALLLSLNLRSLHNERLMRLSFLSANALIIILNILCLLGVPEVRAFFVSHYSIVGPDWTYAMFGIGKPIFTFGSHAIAAFIYFLFVILNLLTYVRKRGLFYLGLSICYIYFELSLACTSSYVYCVVSIIGVCIALSRSSRRGVVGVGLVVVGVLFYLAWNPPVLGEMVGAFQSAGGGGFEGRYSYWGTVHGNLTIMDENPFWPVGMGWSEQQFFGDSGVVEFFLRGSLPLLLCAYVGFYAWVRRNVAWKVGAYVFFVGFISFELAYASLLHIRTLCLLPYFAVYLNSLTEDRVVRVRGQRTGRGLEQARGVVDPRHLAGLRGALGSPGGVRRRGGVAAWRMRFGSEA